MKKFRDVAEKKKKKEKMSRSIGQTLSKVLIYYPIYLPLKKIGEISKGKKKEYWRNHMSELRRKSVNEVVKYVEDEMTKYSCDEFVIYDYAYDEDLFQGDSLLLRCFLGVYSYCYSDKGRKWTKLYSELMPSYDSDWGTDKFYVGFLLSVEDAFEKKYGDIEVVVADKEERVGYFKKEMIRQLSIKFKK